MQVREEHEQIGKISTGLVYRSRKNGILSVERDNMYLVLPNPKELTDIEQLLLDESCKSMDIWIPSGKLYRDGRIIYVLRKSGKKAILNENDELEIIEEAMKE